MLPQLRENFNWPKPATRAGLICCLSEVERWLLETILLKSIFILHIMDSSTWCQAGISAQVLQPPSHSSRGLCGPEPPAQHDPGSRCESCSELTLIQKCFVEGSLADDALQCSGRMLSWYSDQIAFECDRELLSLGVQRLAFHFSLPSAALGSSWNIPGDQLLAPAHPCLLG